MPTTKTVSVRITTEEYDALIALAKAQSVPVGPATLLHHLIRVAISKG